MFQMHRVFCATPWEMEAERHLFCEVIGQFNESDAMPHGLLFIPVSLLNVRDKRPVQYTIDENIRDARFYILALEDGWGPVERNFEKDYRLAHQCLTDPALPMSGVALLLKSPSTSAELPSPHATFGTHAEFADRVRELLRTWLATTIHANVATA